MRTFKAGQEIFLEYTERSPIAVGFDKVMKDIRATVVYADDEVVLTRRDCGPGHDGKRRVLHWIFLAPDWKDDRAQLWKISENLP